MAEGQNPDSNMMMTTEFSRDSNMMMTTEFSRDILHFNILPRLPAKSVGRFRCVSREWHSFLTTTHFAKMQLLHQNHQKILLLSAETPYTFRTIDCETPTTEDGLSASSRPLPFEEFGFSCTSDMRILASLHGLVCMKRHRLDEEGNENTYLILWNPLTSDYKTLSKPICYKDCSFIDFDCGFGLYYSTSDDDYKLICVTCYPEVYIYSLKSDSWRKVETTMSALTSPCTYLSFGVLTPSVLLNEKLYFLRQKHILYGEVDPSYVILMFDTKTEKLIEIVTPIIIKEGIECNGFMVVRGSIHLCVAFPNSGGEYDTIELWRMNSESDGNWTKLVTYSLKALKGYLFPLEKPLHIMRNGDWLMYSVGHVYKRDMNKPTYNVDIVCRFESLEMNLGWKCTETLVSPNQYIN